MVLPYSENYGIYNELVEKGRMSINTSVLNINNIEQHYDWIINILADGIYNPEIQKCKLDITFTDNEDCTMNIFHYLFNLMFWPLILAPGDEVIDSTKIFFEVDFSVGAIANYINKVFLKKYETLLPIRALNNMIDGIFGRYRKTIRFQYWLANTINIKDTVDLMKQYPEFRASVHCDASQVPIEDAKDFGQQAANIQIEIIKNSDHCLRDSFRTGEATSAKQYKEVFANIGPKPDGNGSAYPLIINSNFINGGLDCPESLVIESAIGRQAQILSKENVGFSGNFARLLGLNCMNTPLHPDPTYSCDTKNFIRYTIFDNTYLERINMRWYRTKPNGIDKLIDSDRDKFLIGQTVLLRSPMTCASLAHGKGICYKCYGNLAYVNNDINIGKIAAEEQTSRFTQKLLSAKHLLESLIIKMNWNGPIFDFFAVDYDNICTKIDIDYTNYKIKLVDICIEDEYDDIEYNSYVTEFYIITPEGNEHKIYTSDSDNIYLQPVIAEMAMNIANNDEDTKEIILDINKIIKNSPIIFKIRIKNNELQATMNRIEKIINLKAEIKKYDKDEFLYEFMSTNIKGGITLNSVHFEVILANQIRAADSLLEFPDWEIEDVPYQLVTLDSSLLESPYLMTRLLNSKLSYSLIKPSIYKINKPSGNDVFAMINSPKYLTMDPGIHSGKDNNLLSDDEENALKTHNLIRHWNSIEERERFRKLEEENSVDFD